jgi:hypothetical protein
VASRDEIVSRIGRSPDFGSAYVLALMGGSARPVRPIDPPSTTCRLGLQRDLGQDDLIKGIPDPFLWAQLG